MSVSSVGPPSPPPAAVRTEADVWMCSGKHRALRGCVLWAAHGGRGQPSARTPRPWSLGPRARQVAVGGGGPGKKGASESRSRTWSSGREVAKCHALWLALWLAQRADEQRCTAASLLLGWGLRTVVACKGGVHMPPRHPLPRPGIRWRIA